MQTAEDFMQCYLREKVELHRLLHEHNMPFLQKFFADDYVKYLEARHAWRDNNPEHLESAEVFDAAAKFITVESFGGRQQRFRYQLLLSGTTWRIHTIEWKCFACRGMGLRGSNACKYCKGTGWRDPTRPSLDQPPESPPINS